MPVREQEVSEIWADVLGIHEVDVDTNFFDLGGNSLLLVKLASQLNQRLCIDADVLMLMEYPTVAEFSRHWNRVEVPVDDNH
ncbi:MULTISPECIES: acyl carrier protein [Actinomadura]|uniref:Acyl carrier protein n=1 Tax=Actinomadura yumaensis TaxID=111807 RepID=A0ABW2CLC3_9ACTN|nr:acyl carrier protein [Actinomadura sp. J1-007]MWK37149.1 hypothetical protein [Actinomadura sp. J1-007]